MTVEEVIKKHNMTSKDLPQTDDRSFYAECSNCGECCSAILPITLDEIKAINDYIEKHPNVRDVAIKNSRPYKDSSGATTINTLCPFRDQEKKCCTVYDVRPSICKTFCCWNKPNDIIHNRTEHEMKADFNNINPKTGEYSKKVVTMWELFNLPLVTHDIFIIYTYLGKMKFHNKAELMRCVNILNQNFNLVNNDLKEAIKFCYGGKEL